MTPGRKIPPVQLTAEEREILERWTRRPTTAQGLARCARATRDANRSDCHSSRRVDKYRLEPDYSNLESGCYSTWLSPTSIVSARKESDAIADVADEFAALTGKVPAHSGP